MINKTEKTYISNLMIDAFEDFLLYIRNVDFDKRDKNIGITIRQINTVCTQFSQTILHLILEDYLWESEILLRTVIEGSIKLTYIACEPDQIENKMFEFSQVLPFFFTSLFFFPVWLFQFLAHTCERGCHRGMSMRNTEFFFFKVYSLRVFII